MRLGDIKDKLMPMLDDAHWAELALEREDNQFTRRAYIRSLFGMIEGTVWILKQTILHAPVQKGGVKRLSAAEYALLSDKTYDLKSNGEPKEQTKFLRLPENIRFTFNVISKYFGISVGLRDTQHFQPNHTNILNADCSVLSEGCYSLMCGCEKRVIFSCFPRPDSLFN